MPAPKRAKPKDERPFPRQLKRLNVDKEFNRLVKGGCDPAILERWLRLIQQAKNANTWEKLTGIGRREISTVRKRLWNAAFDLERLGNSYQGWLYLSELCWLYPEIGEFWPQIPHLIREFVCNLNLNRRQYRLKPTHRPASNFALACLVRYVIQATKAPHDPEVAALAAVFENRRDFTADALKDWRQKNALRLKSSHLTILDFLFS